MTLVIRYDLIQLRRLKAQHGSSVDAVIGQERADFPGGSLQSDGTTRARAVRVRPSGGRPWNTMFGSTYRYS